MMGSGHLRSHQPPIMRQTLASMEKHETLEVLSTMRLVHRLQIPQKPCICSWISLDLDLLVPHGEI